MQTRREIARVDDDRRARPARPDGADPGSGDAVDALARAGADLADVARSVGLCRGCRRRDAVRVFGSGSPRAPLMLLTHRPLTADLATGTVLTAEADALQRAFASLSIPLSWVYATAAVKCGDAASQPDEVAACAGHLLTEIEAVAPSLLVAFGAGAYAAFAALDGRCGLDIPGDPGEGAFAVRANLRVMVTEQLPDGVTDPEAKRRLWADLRALPALLSGD